MGRREPAGWVARSKKGNAMGYVLPTGAAWLVTAILVEAAVIDGRDLKVPNWLTFHLALGGLAFWAFTGGLAAIGWSAGGLVVGLMLLLPLHLIGGMGGGDVKLYAGVGAWVGPMMALEAFAVSAIVGGVMALGMIAIRGGWGRHWATSKTIVREVATIRHPDRLSEIAAERKPSMTLLPYGIPLAIGSIGYFAWVGLLG